MRVLLVEDEKSLARVIEVELLLQGMEVEIRGDGRSGLAAALEGGWDLLILDWMLPDVEGIDVCRLLRSRGADLPIIMITAKQGVSYEVRGLREGADDYIVKPFDMEQLLARIRAVTRRLKAPGREESARLSYGGLVVNKDEHAVYENGVRVHLTKKEYEILVILLANRGKVMTKEAIFSSVWGEKVHLEEGVLAVHVKAIRNKLEGRYIENVRGIGYLIPREAQP